MQPVYVVMYGYQESNELLGVFSDYVKAREFEINYKARHMLSAIHEWIEVRKVELDKVYGRLDNVGEEV